MNTQRLKDIANKTYLNKVHYALYFFRLKI